MKYFKDSLNAGIAEPHEVVIVPVFTKENTPIPGATVAIGEYNNTEYTAPGVHDDHEGFYVYAGHGFARVGEEESKISLGSCFYAPAGVPHQVKRATDSEIMKVFLFHFL